MAWLLHLSISIYLYKSLKLASMTFLQWFFQILVALLRSRVQAMLRSSATRCSSRPDEDARVQAMLRSSATRCISHEDARVPPTLICVVCRSVPEVTCRMRDRTYCPGCVPDLDSETGEFSHCVLGLRDDAFSKDSRAIL